MTIVTTEVLKDLNGTPIKDKTPDGMSQKDICVSDIAVAALLTETQQERALTWKDKMDRYELAVKIKKNEVVDLNAAEIAEIETLVANCFPPLIVGAFHDAIETLNNVKKEAH